MKAVGILTILLSCGCNALSPTENVRIVALGKTDVEQIVTASVSEFFTGKTLDTWTKGEIVLIDSKWGHIGRYYRLEKKNESFDTFFERSLEELKLSVGESDNVSPEFKQHLDKQLVALTRIQKEFRKGLSLVPPTLPDLKDLELDSRIVVRSIRETRELKRTHGWLPGEISIKNGKGKKGTLRVFALLGPPMFSPNGKFAILVMGVPWSINSAILHFYLEKTSSGWTVVNIGENYYL